MKERRQTRRFTLRLPCLIYDWNGTGKDILFQTYTRNVGIGGASIDSGFPLPTGMRIGLTLLIRVTGSSTDIGQTSCVSLAARILRVGDESMSVVFGDAYQIMPAVHLAGQCRAVFQWLDQWAPVPEKPATVDTGFGLAQDANKLSLLAALSTPSSNGR